LFGQLDDVTAPKGPLVTGVVAPVPGFVIVYEHVNVLAELAGNPAGVAVNPEPVCGTKLAKFAAMSAWHKAYAVVDGPIVESLTSLPGVLQRRHVAKADTGPTTSATNITYF